MTGTTKDKIKVKILQNFLAFTEYMNFKHTVSARCFLEYKSPYDELRNEYVYIFVYALNKKILLKKIKSSNSSHFKVHIF